VTQFCHFQVKSTTAFEHKSAQHVDRFTTSCWFISCHQVYGQSWGDVDLFDFVINNNVDNDDDGDAKVYEMSVVFVHYKGVIVSVLHLVGVI